MSCVLVPLPASWCLMPSGMFLAFRTRLADTFIPIPSPHSCTHLCTNSSRWRTWVATIPGHPHFEECRGHSRAECPPAPPGSVLCPAGTHTRCLAPAPRPGSSASTEWPPPSCRHGGTVPLPHGDNSSSGSSAQPKKATSGHPLLLGAAWTRVRGAQSSPLWDNLAWQQLPWDNHSHCWGCWCRVFV